MIADPLVGTRLSANCRNPMYVGHIIFVPSLGLSLRSRPARGLVSLRQGVYDSGK